MSGLSHKDTFISSQWNETRRLHVICGSIYCTLLVLFALLVCICWNCVCFYMDTRCVAYARKSGIFLLDIVFPDAFFPSVMSLPSPSSFFVLPLTLREQPVKSAWTFLVDNFYWTHSSRVLFSGHLTLYGFVWRSSPWGHGKILVDDWMAGLNCVNRHLKHSYGQHLSLLSFSKSELGVHYTEGSCSITTSASHRNLHFAHFNLKDEQTLVWTRAVCLFFF